MPYLHCPNCRLTLYKPRALVDSAERCPRCDTRLSQRPRSLFERAGRDPAGARPASGGPTVLPPAAR